MSDAVDVIIVGAGAAGPVLAARLSEDANLSVALLEAGGENVADVGRMQGAFFYTWGTPMDWQYKTVPQPGLAQRQIAEPRGKVMGGSTALNVGAWMRGCAADYDAWEQAGATGWNAAEALAIYRRIEDSPHGPNAWRGRGGPLAMQPLPTPTPFSDTLLEGFVQAGLGPRGDVNGEDLSRADRYETLFPDGVRRTPADAYLNSTARQRPNLRIITGAHVTRVLFAGQRAVGVAYQQDGQTRQLQARREVVLCAGAFGTPQLLMLSGVGPAAHLQAHGIPVTADLPGVGAHLQEHLVATVRVLSPQGAGGPLPQWPTPEDLDTWRAQRQGPAAYWVQNGVGFIRSHDELADPDVELMFQYTPDASGSAFAHVPDAAERGGYTVSMILLQPRSRGTVRLASADPMDAPLIDPAFLSDPQDAQTLLHALQTVHRITRTPALAPHTEHVHPAPEATPEALQQWLSQESGIAFHPVGTARMGRTDDDMAVVGPDLRVRGVQGLRVADASVFPSLIRGHTMAPAVMVGERAAALMRNARPRMLNPG